METASGAKAIKGRVEKKPNDTAELRLEAFGDPLKSIALVAALRDQLPALRNVAIEETSLSGVRPEEAHPEIDVAKNASKAENRKPAA